MKDSPDPGATPRQARDGTPTNDPIPVSAVRRPRTAANGHEANAHSGKTEPILDAWTALDIIAQRWQWLLLGALIGAAGLFAVGYKLIKPKYTAQAQLLRYETPGEKEFFSEPLSAETFTALIKSPELLRRVGEQATPKIPPETFLKIIKVEQMPDSDVIRMLLAGRQPKFAVDLLNTYATNAVDFAREWYAEKAKIVVTQYLERQVAQMDRDIKTLDQQFRNLRMPDVVNEKLAQVGGALTALSTNIAVSAPTSPTLIRQRERLDKAMAELNDLLGEYTEMHPKVVAKQEEIKELEGKIKKESATVGTKGSTALITPAPVASTQVATPRGADGSFNPEIDIVRMKLMALEEGRAGLSQRFQQAKQYAENPPGVVKMYAPATMQSVQANKRVLKIGIGTVFGAMAGMVAALCLVFLVEATDNRLKTADDVKRVTRLPVLTTLGNLREMSPESRSQWAFRTWTMLQGRLSPSANHGLVCGITSAEAGEGRTTWIRLLAEAASLTGFRVLTIATKPSPTNVQLTEGTKNAPEPRKEAKPNANGSGLNGSHVPVNGHGNGSATSHGPGALTPSVLTTPSQVTEQLTGPNSQPMVHIPLPGWVWNLERRKQWGEALEQWRQIDNLVILVELPPASVPESVLLGSNLPNMLWLTNSGTADAGDTRVHLDTLRHARCNLVGAVLNRETAMPVKKRFPRWLGCVAAIAAMSQATAMAQIVATPAQTGTNEITQPAAGATIVDTATAPEVHAEPAFSIVRPSQKAAWQQHLTLGPGDVLSFALYGKPELTRADVAIGPDGRVSYLQAQDILATGLTIDELRQKLDQEIGRYVRAARTIVTPVAFRSKKYYVLGKVMTKGVYTLDRPLTVLEAIARAHGLENGLIDRNVVDLADFQRSFLIRGGKRIPLNFEKLFQEGDLTQNLPIEPGDYLYFASADVKEVYVVGEVRLPGPVTYNPDLTLIGAITSRGGYTERAFKNRVLIVRGPLDHPDRIIVDTHNVLYGKGLDFKVQPRDIIYVNSRPFIRVEELADLAATAFLQSLITSWVGVDVVKPIP